MSDDGYYCRWVPWSDAVASLVPNHLHTWMTHAGELTSLISETVGPESYNFKMVSIGEISELPKSSMLATSLITKENISNNNDEDDDDRFFVRQIQHCSGSTALVHAYVVTTLADYESPGGEALRTLGHRPIGRTLLYAPADNTDMEGAGTRAARARSEWTEFAYWIPRPLEDDKDDRKWFARRRIFKLHHEDIRLSIVEKFYLIF
eukprot:PhM_4_TR3138/c0_g1_i1/m.18143